MTPLASLLAEADGIVRQIEHGADDPLLAAYNASEILPALLAALRTSPVEEDWREITRGHRCYSCADDGGASGCHPVNCGHNARVTTLRARVEAERDAALSRAAAAEQALADVRKNFEALTEVAARLKAATPSTSE